MAQCMYFPPFYALQKRKEKEYSFMDILHIKEKKNLCN